MAEAKPKSDKYFYATGRRKTAIALVKLSFGGGELLINEKKSEITESLKKPLQVTNNLWKLDVIAKVTGGGKASQLSAIRLGISRALVKKDLDSRLSLKKSGLLTRDPREKERKKYGLKRARKAPQWSKR